MTYTNPSVRFFVASPHDKFLIKIEKVITGGKKVYQWPTEETQLREAIDKLIGILNEPA
jgi:hypothetical protein